MTNETVKAQFKVAMYDEVYVRAKEEVGYNATRFLEMITSSDPYEVALGLVRSSKPSEGYTALWERKRLDLTVEALILDDRWDTIFDDPDRARAVKRLHQYKHPIPARFAHMLPGSAVRH